MSAPGTGDSVPPVDPATEPLAQRGVGAADAFQRLWTPHRLAYIARGIASDSAVEPVCPFCAIPGMGDREGLIVARGAQVFAVLNLYPYNPGHLMCVPYRHVADYADLTAAETTELATFTQRGLEALRACTGAHGFNVGMNLGSVAGAGIAAHLHQHLVPRWGGDTNFMPVIGQTKVLPQLLADTRERVAAAWPS